MMTQSQNMSYSDFKKKKKIKTDEVSDKVEFFYVTFVAPNVMEGLQMREIFDEAIL